MSNLHTPSVTRFSSIIQNTNIRHEAAAHNALNANLDQSGQTLTNRTDRWMRAGADIAGTATSVLGGIAAQTVFAPFVIAIIASNNDPGEMLQDINYQGRVIMKPVGALIGAIVGISLSGAANLTEFIATPIIAKAYSVFTSATKDASCERHVHTPKR